MQSTNPQDAIIAFLEQIDLYLIQAKVKERTKREYRPSLLDYAGWCRSEGLNPFTVEAPQVLQYKVHLEGRGLAVSSINHRLSPISEVYWYLVKTGRMRSNPVRDVRYVMPPVAPMRGLTIPQLRMVLAACQTPLQRGIVGLLAINGLSIGEIEQARIEHLTSRGGMPALSLPNRKQQNELPFTVLPPIVESALIECRGERLHGPLLLTAIGTAANRFTMRDHLRRISARVGFQPPLNPRVLKDTMRIIAVQQGFSAASIVKAVGENDMRRFPKWLAESDVPLHQHAAWRIGRLIEVEKGSVDALLDYSEDLLHESDLPPSVAVTLAAGAFERYLREWSLSVGYKGQKKDIVAYISFLRSSNNLTERDVRRGHEIAQSRDLAAHGWFEKVSSDDAHWVIQEIRSFLTRMATAQ